jgi:hypothetical protein
MKTKKITGTTPIKEAFDLVKEDLDYVHSSLRDGLDRIAKLEATMGSKSELDEVKKTVDQILLILSKRL